MLKRPNRTFISIYYKKRINNTKKPLVYGNFGFFSKEHVFLTKESIEAARIVISKIIKKRRAIKGSVIKQKGDMLMRLVFKVPITKKGTKLSLVKIINKLKSLLKKPTIISNETLPEQSEQLEELQQLEDDKKN